MKKTLLFLFAMILGLPLCAQNQKEWTIMVWLSAKNNLATEAIADINEMESVGSTDQFNIVTELSYKGKQPADKAGIPSSRRLIVKDDDPNAVTSPAVVVHNRFSMASGSNLADFINWSKTNYPAKKYMLVIWGHGGGWLGTSGGSSLFSGNLSIREVRGALKKTGGADIVFFDACNMQEITVVYALRDMTKYVIASQETMPGFGLDYHALLSSLAEKPAMSPLFLADATYSAFMQQFRTPSPEAQVYLAKQTITLSVLDMAKLPAFTEAVKGWTEAMLKGNQNGLYMRTLPKSRQFGDGVYHDLINLIYNISSDSTKPLVRERANVVLESARDFILLAGALGRGREDGGINGVSIYSPEGAVPTRYAFTDWSKATDWISLIDNTVH